MQGISKPKKYWIPILIFLASLIQGLLPKRLYAQRKEIVPEYRLKRLETLVTSGSWKQACAEANSIVQSYAEEAFFDSPFYRNAVQTCLHAGDAKGADAFLEKEDRRMERRVVACKDNPCRIRSYMEVAKTYREAERFKPALDRLRKALQIASAEQAALVAKEIRITEGLEELDYRKWDPEYHKRVAAERRQSDEIRAFF